MSGRRHDALRDLRRGLLVVGAMFGGLVVNLFVG